MTVNLIVRPCRNTKTRLIIYPCYQFDSQENNLKIFISPEADRPGTNDTVGINAKLHEKSLGKGGPPT